MSILPVVVIIAFFSSHIYAFPGTIYKIKRGFHPSLQQWQTHISPLKRVPKFGTAKRVRPLMMAPAEMDDEELAKFLDLEAVLQERGGANELAEDILFDLKSLLRDDRGAIRDPEKLRSVARSVLDEIDPDDPKRLLRIS